MKVRVPLRRYPRRSARRGILLLGVGSLQLAGCGGDSAGPETSGFPSIAGTWVVEADPIVTKNTCPLEVPESELAGFAGESGFIITQQGGGFTILNSTPTLSGTIEPGGAFKTKEVIVTDTFVEGRITLRFWIEGTVSGDRMDVQMPFHLTFLDPPETECEMVFSLVANRTADPLFQHLKAFDLSRLLTPAEPPTTASHRSPGRGGGL